MKNPLTEVPIDIIEAIKTMPIKIAIIAYSIALAPERSPHKARNCPRIRRSMTARFCNNFTQIRKLSQEFGCGHGK